MKLGDPILLTWRDAVSEDTEYIYLRPDGTPANAICGRLTQIGIHETLCYWIGEQDGWVLVAWHHYPNDEEGKWATTLRVPTSWIISIKKVAIGRKLK